MGALNGPCDLGVLSVILENGLSDFVNVNIRHLNASI